MKPNKKPFTKMLKSETKKLDLRKSKRLSTGKEHIHRRRINKYKNKFKLSIESRLKLLRENKLLLSSTSNSFKTKFMWVKKMHRSTSKEPKITLRYTSL
jgi:hypothetical protein